MKKYNFAGIGLVFGTAIGALIATLFSLEVYWMLVGTSVGLLVGSMVDSNISKK